MTPMGDMMIPSAVIAPCFQPRAVEVAWYGWLEGRCFFHTNVSAARGRTVRDALCVMVIPPPNVTGSLHHGHGHTLMRAVEDALTGTRREEALLLIKVPLSRISSYNPSVAFLCRIY